MRCQLVVLSVVLAGLRGVAGDAPSATLDKLNAIVRPGDLVSASKGFAEPVQALFGELSRPADRLTLKDDKVLLIRPVADFLSSKPVLTDPLEVQIVGEKDVTPRTVAPGEASSFVPYEQMALERIGVFLRIEVDGIKETDRLTAADMALRAVLRFHDGARRRPARGISPWDDLRGQLEQQLLNGRRKLVERLTADAIRSDSADTAMPVVDCLLNAHRQDSVIRAQAKRLWVAKAAGSHKKQDWPALRSQLTRIDEEFAFASDFDVFRQALKNRAEALLKEAGSDDAGKGKLKEAFELWPRLPGLREALANRQKSFTTLYVAVRSLPEFLSPATAWTDSEQQAVELLFEGLVERETDAKGGVHYVSRLAGAAASQDSRRFEMMRDAYWSDGSRVSAGDVRHTVQLLRRNDLPGRSAVWSASFDLPGVDVNGFAAEFKLTQGLFDNLHPFSFKILPEQYKGSMLVRADDEAFAKAPVGSGPFVLRKREAVGERTYVVFGANPHFVRHAAPGRPFIHEICMFAWRDAKDLAGLPHPVHVVLGIPTEQTEVISKRTKLPIQNLPSPRVHFLAINHRKPILADVNWRRAMAHAIHREKLLTDHFRGGHSGLRGIEAVGAAIAIGALQHRQGHNEFHHVLSGPYPLKSWATCPPPRVPASPNDPALAKTLARQVLKPKSVTELTLKYPADEVGAQGACKEIAVAIERLGKEAKAVVHVKTIGLSPREMKSALENRDFDLAYHHHDHSDAGFDLWPLFDPSPDAVRAGGSNYLGYDGDAKLQGLLRSAQSHRNFTALQEFTHNIHARIYDQMPLIPLWQLHSHIAISPTVVTGAIDPLSVFNNVAEWKVQR